MSAFGVRVAPGDLSEQGDVSVQVVQQEAVEGFVGGTLGRGLDDLLQVFGSYGVGDV